MQNDEELNRLQQRVTALEARISRLRTGRLILMNLLRDREIDHQRELANLEVENRLLRERPRSHRQMS